MTALDGFNPIASYYDTLKRIVFGKSIYDSQVEFLQMLPAGGNFLVVGGGSGEMLKPLFQLNPHCRVWFVEASSQMLETAVAMSPVERRVNIRFIHGTENTATPNIIFDGIITNFFLDLFPDDEVQGICRRLKTKLRIDGLWLVSDFASSGRWWQAVLLRAMYLFFRVTCRIPARRLPSWQDQFQLAGIEEVASAFFYKGFIKSCIYKRKV